MKSSGYDRGLRCEDGDYRCSGCEDVRRVMRDRYGLRRIFQASPTAFLKPVPAEFSKDSGGLCVHARKPPSERRVRVEINCFAVWKTILRAILQPDIHVDSTMSEEGRNPIAVSTVE